MLNKVPEITVYFWVIKILCTTVGETAADHLNENLGLGLTNTTYIMGAVLIAVLVFQFRARKYVPGIYWLAVVLISVVGTLVSDNLVDNLGVALRNDDDRVQRHPGRGLRQPGTRVERTLSVHTIVTTRREALLLAGDPLHLRPRHLGRRSALREARTRLPGRPSGSSPGRSSSSPSLHFGLRMNAILAFWLAYILTRPLGASIGDYLASPNAEGGLGLGTNLTSFIFLGSDPRAGRLSRDLEAGRDRGSRGRPWHSTDHADRGRRGCWSSPTRRRRRRRWSRRCANGPRPARPGSSSWSPTPTTCAFDRVSQPTPARARMSSSAPCRYSRSRPAEKVRGPGRKQPQRLRRHRRGAEAAASYARSSSRPSPATSPTGCTSTFPSGSPTSAIR